MIIDSSPARRPRRGLPADAAVARRRGERAEDHSRGEKLRGRCEALLLCQPRTRWLGKSLRPPGRGRGGRARGRGRRRRSRRPRPGRPARASLPAAAGRAAPLAISKRLEATSQCGTASPAAWAASPRRNARRRFTASAPMRAPEATCRETITAREGSRSRREGLQPSARLRSHDDASRASPSLLSSPRFAASAPAGAQTPTGDRRGRDCRRHRCRRPHRRAGDRRAPDVRRPQDHGSLRSAHDRSALGRAARPWTCLPGGPRCAGGRAGHRDPAPGDRQRAGDPYLGQPAGQVLPPRSVSTRAVLSGLTPHLTSRRTGESSRPTTCA